MTAPKSIGAPQEQRPLWRLNAQDLLQADEITLEFLSFRSFADLEGPAHLGDLNGSFFG